MGIFKCHLIPPICCLVQPIQIAVSKPTCTKRTTWIEIESSYYVRLRTRRVYVLKLTQLVLRKNKKCIILVQILVEVYGEITNELWSSLYFLGKKKTEKLVKNLGWVRTMSKCDRIVFVPETQQNRNQITIIRYIDVYLRCICWKLNNPFPKMLRHYVTCQAELLSDRHKSLATSCWLNRDVSEEHIKPKNVSFHSLGYPWCHIVHCWVQILYFHIESKRSNTFLTVVY